MLTVILSAYGISLFLLGVIYASSKEDPFSGASSLHELVLVVLLSPAIALFVLGMYIYSLGRKFTQKVRG